MRIESAPPLESRSFRSDFLKFEVDCDRAAGIVARSIGTIHVFIDYQFLTRYYEDARLVLTGF
jgi:hypothetical protein